MRKKTARNLCRYATRSLCPKTLCTAATSGPTGHRSTRATLVFTLVFGAAFWSSWGSPAEQLEATDTLRFGMSTALSGPAADLGKSMRAGVAAAFAEQNRQHGIHGRQLELVVLDDGYEPVNTAPNMRTLIEGDKVLGVVGNVGTPTAVAAIPIAVETRTPFFGAFTGAGVLRRTPPDRFVINFRASYAQETSAMVEALIAAGIKPQEVAFFTQRDAYGDAGFSHGIDALSKYSATVRSGVAHGTYERNTLAVEGGLADILMHDPPAKAVIMIGTYASCAKFIRLAREVDFQPLFLNVSFVGSASLAHDLGELGEGVVITQVVPHYDSDVPLARDARRALAEIDAVANFCSLEGYAVGQILCLALDRISGTVTRESITESLENLGQFDIGMGRALELSATRHQASDHVWPTVIHGGKVVPTTWSEAVSRGVDRP